MGLELSEIHADDESSFKELIECEWISFESPYNGFFQIYCPIIGTGPNVRQDWMKESTERQLSWHREDPTSTWLKVVDSDSGQIVGGAQWNVYLENPYPNGVEHTDAVWWPEGEGRKYASMALEQWYAPRGRRMNKAHIRKMFMNVVGYANICRTQHMLCSSSASPPWSRLTASGLGSSTG